MATLSRAAGARKSKILTTGDTGVHGVNLVIRGGCGGGLGDSRGCKRLVVPRQSQLLVGGREFPLGRLGCRRRRLVETGWRRGGILLRLRVGEPCRGR